MAAIVLFYTSSSKTTKAIFEDYAGEITHDEYKELIAWLKERKFSHLVFSLRYPYGIEAKKKETYIYTHTMSNKLTVFSQLLDELQQNKVIKAECEEDLRYTLLNRYPGEAH